MGLEVGVVGLPNAGKSTLFNALTQAGALVASYPFTTIEPHVGIAEVPDDRLEALGRLIRPEKLVPATVKFVDIAGLVAGAHRGEGLGNQFLAHIREVDALAVVLRCFEHPDVPHPDAVLNPLADLEVLDLELILADLGTVERRIEKTLGQAKARPREYEDVLSFLERLRAHLQAGGRAAIFPERSHMREIQESLFLLTDKPRLLVANVGESDLPDGGPLGRQVLAKAREEHSEGIVLCADLEAGLTAFETAEAQEYLRGVGLTGSGLERFIAACRRLLGLITFFTVTGGEVVRAWTLRQGQTAWDAAGEIHTDMQRGFIRADVVSIEALLEMGSLARVRDVGRARSEGRDYLVQDGDVLHIHFRV